MDTIIGKTSSLPHHRAQHGHSAIDRRAGADGEPILYRTRSTAAEPHSVAVVGAGVSGLVCARKLKDHGVDVAIFDKAGRPGGRLATRLAKVGEYDHGAQYFTVREPMFERQVRSWRRDGVVAEWRGRLIRVEGDRRSSVPGDTPRFVGVPGMNSVAAHLAEDLDIRARSNVQSITRRGGRWFLETESEEAGPFDRVVVAVPAPQAATLVEAIPTLRQHVDTVRMNSCWAVLATFPSAIDTDFDGAFVEDGPLSWVARNRSKPGRKAAESWVLHASHGWTIEHLETESDQVIATLLGRFAQVARVKLPAAIDSQAHRWRYALADETLSTPCLFDRNSAVAVCGDWCLGTRVEDAFISGSAAANRVLDSPGASGRPSRP